MNDEMQQSGKNPNGQLNQLQQQMDETEKQLVNRNINADLLKRQQEIINHMLEAENAEQQRETDNQRQSTAGSQVSKASPPDLTDYIKQKQAELELLENVPPDLKPFYHDLVEKYFQSLQH